ncbi:ThuA domain-containing protein [Sphingobacterium hungaricum]|uniref:Crp/Fnr family transcriptional regulator n=1 Tax=Sphingobacterium hungaricum TaxID=2082723 RepID=A0A928YRD4_9SPHI|nr:ThuA domain-containing protein [Sphingobacterium hungaricum]MBE8714869.1 Crp/Fnr family transcriptional regulator [Sphingobacterium hungaricum]
MMRKFVLWSILCLSFIFVNLTFAQEKQIHKVLIFTKTAGFRHESIPKGTEVLSKLLKDNSFQVEHTEESSVFTPEKLNQFSCVIFLNTTGDILDASQKNAFEQYIQAGHGFVGIHAASDTEYSWPWYGQLVGGYFMSHPAVQEAKIDVVNHKHPATQHLQKVWMHKDEWYDFKDVQKDKLTLLMLLDETSYKGGKMGKFHPISWFHQFDGGRSFYTGLGHTNESYDSPAFQQHVLGGILWAMGLKEVKK